MTDRSTRDLSIDLIKVIAIFGVLVIHVDAGVLTQEQIGSFEWICGRVWGSLVRGSVPLFLMTSGALMLNPRKELALKKLYFHKNRSNHMDDNFHILKDDYSSIKMQVTHKENQEDKVGELLVIIQLTQPIKDTDLVGVLNANDYILRYEISGQIDYDIINSVKQINEYAQHIVSDIAELHKKSNISKIKICSAASSDFVFALGTKFSKTQNIDIIVYQFEKGRYSWGINVTKKTAVINNTYC